MLHETLSEKQKGCRPGRRRKAKKKAPFFACWQDKPAVLATTGKNRKCLPPDEKGACL